MLAVCRLISTVVDHPLRSHVPAFFGTIELDAADLGSCAPESTPSSPDRAVPLCFVTEAEEATPRISGFLRNLSGANGGWKRRWAQLEGVCYPK